MKTGGKQSENMLKTRKLLAVNAAEIRLYTPNIVGYDQHCVIFFMRRK